LIGPGLGRGAYAQKLVERCVRASERPVVIDADALNAFEGEPAAFAALIGSRRALLTPHPLEFARLAGVDAATVNVTRFDVAGQLARTTGAAVLLKGVPTVVSAPDGRTVVSASGTPVLGQGGSGDMLAGMGITADTVGAPIRASMETVEIGVSANGFPVHIDRFAAEADGVIVVNRIKPHVAFRGPCESGLMKMIVIGMGKQKGADICHELGFGKMAENILSMGRVTLAKTNIICGVGILENACHETAQLEVMTREEIPVREPALLEEG